MKIEEILRKVIKIRLFEKKLLELYDQGLLNGTTHTCIGQEIIPVFFSQFLNNEDQIFQIIEDMDIFWLFMKINSKNFF